MNWYNWDKDEETLQKTLSLIKRHITEQHNQQNLDLHNAVQLLVTYARKNGHLER